MIDEETESYINQNFLNICKKNVYNVEDSNDDSNDDGDNQEFDNRWFYCKSAGRDDVDDDYYDQDGRDDHDAHELMVEGFIVVLQDLLVLWLWWWEIWWYGISCYQEKLWKSLWSQP